MEVEVEPPPEEISVCRDGASISLVIEPALTDWANLAHSALSA